MYLIDGNNLIGQRGRGYENWFKDKPKARRQLLEDLARLASVRKMQLTVVFDGAPETHFPDGSSFRGVKLFYARPGSDADARIIELVERERNRKNLIVVTSDNALAARVRVCGVRVQRAGEFRQWLEAARQAPRQPNEPTVAHQEMDEWMRYFGVDGDEDDWEEEEDF